MKKVSICCSLRPLREKEQETPTHDGFSKQFGVRRGARIEGILAERARRAEVSDYPSNKVLRQIEKKAVVGQALPDNALKGHLLCSLRPLREKVAEGRMRGFTLIELLVVVMIIAILAAIAVPQYKKAVLKSRFSTMMPMAKSIADAQEVYYQGRHLYALDVDELDVTPVNAENTSVSLSQTDGYDYVMAQNSQVPGANYIIYQKYSENYPSEIHCEAADDNEDAQWLCGVLSNNNSIGKTITDGYTTYIINGTGAGVVPGTFEQAEDNTNPMSCDKAIEMGFTCTSDETTGIKKICQNGVCRTKTYNEDGSYTSITCQADSNGVCTANWSSITYDADGKPLKRRTCGTIATDGSCNVYATGQYQVNYDYTYDTNGNLLAQYRCNGVTSNDSCSTRSFGWYFTYDTNGNQLTKRECSTVGADGSCSVYSGSGAIDYAYDANGNQISSRQCKSDKVASDGTCNEYSGSSSLSTDFTYDANGNKISERRCSSFASNGSCSMYTGQGAFFTYDTNGNQISSQWCNTIETDGSCSAYSSTKTEYVYDDNGNQLASRGCSVDSSGNCTEYSYAYDYTYDESGKQIYSQYCNGGNLNTSTGECNAYNSTSVTAN